MLKTNKKRALIGCLLSVVPGCGHLYFGRWPKSLSLFVIDVALCAGIFFSHSWVIQVLMLVVYGVILFSCVAEMQVLSGLKPESPFRDSKGYIAFLLITAGVNALPFLWQSKAYGVRGKVVWRIAVPLLAVLFFGGLFLIARG